MSFIENIAEEGVVDYFARRLSFFFSLVVMAFTISYLMFGAIASGKNVIITVALVIIAVANFIVALVMFIKYEQLKKSKNIKFAKAGIKYAKILVSIISCILTITLMITGDGSDSFFMRATILFLVVFYCLSFTIQIFLLIRKTRKLIKEKNKKR